MGASVTIHKFFNFILLLTNIICSIIGIILIVFGGYLLIANYEDAQNVLSLLSDNHVVSITAVSFGLITLLVSTFGVCGSLAESLIFIKIYTYLLGLLTILQIAIAIFAAVNKNYTILAEMVWSGSDNSGKKFIQDKFKCCGFKNVGEYDENGLPESCIKDGNFKEGYQHHGTGCEPKIIAWAEEEANFVPFIVGAGVIIGLQVFMFLMSFGVACCKPKNRHSFRASAGPLGRRAVSISTTNNNPTSKSLGHVTTNANDDSFDGTTNMGFIDDEYDELSQRVEQRMSRG